MRDYRRIAIPAEAIARAIAFAVGQPDAAQVGEERRADDKRLDGANPFGDSLFTDRVSAWRER